MSLYNIDWQAYWKDGPQLPVRRSPQLQVLSDGTLVQEVTAVAKDLLCGAYELGTVSLPFEPTENLEVYDALTMILPTLSEQSTFYWHRAARSLASMLATAKYPIRAQASHLIFWWARLGGLMGPTSIEARVGEQLDSTTSDGSNLEFSWAIPQDTDPSHESNRRVRFCIDAFHPERGHRIAGGAILDYLWSPEGNMGLVKNEPGSKDWKDILENWLFPDLKSTEEFVEGNTYMIAFDLEPSGGITLKIYYIPPHLPAPGTQPKNRVATYRVTDDLEPFVQLSKRLHPSLEPACKMFVDFVRGDGKESHMKWFMVAVDVTKREKNRLKVYVLSQRTTLKDMIYDMTLGGKISGPQIDDAMANFSKFFAHLFPYVNDSHTNIQLQNEIDDKDVNGNVSS
ncbi:hypothetical protein H0H93_007776 [Arthromyces matolae]|nr:hypothetical protein H0H93_007776 [Arthromyces matolae]